MSLSAAKNGQPVLCSTPVKIIRRVGQASCDSASTPWSLLKDDDGEASIVVDYGRAEGGIPFYEAAEVISSNKVVEIDVVYSETYEGIDKEDGDGPFFLFSNAMNTYRRHTHSFAPSKSPNYIEERFAQRSQRYVKIILKTPRSSVSFSKLGFRHVRLPNATKNSFTCSNEKLNNIWKDGVRTVDMCTVEAGETANAWEVTESGTMIHGQHWAPCRQGTRWSNKIVRFEVDIESGGASWGIHMVANGLIFCLDVGKRSLAAFEGLANTSGVFPCIERGTWTINPEVQLGDWIKIESIAKGPSVSVSINGQQIATVNDLDIHPILGGSGNNTGSVAFGGPANYAAKYRFLSVTDDNGKVLYENDLLLSNKGRTLADFQVGTNGVSCSIDGAKRDRACFGGDLFVMGRSLYYSTANLEAAMGSIKLLTSHQTKDGYLGNLLSIQAPLHDDSTDPPTYAFYSLSYALLLVVAIKDYYMHSGDITTLQNVFDRLNKLIEFTERFMDDRGLILAPPPLSMDWFPMGGPLFGASGKINIAYYDALQSMSKLSAAIGIKDRFSNRAKALKESIVIHLWNGETGTMRMSDTASPTGICQDINAYAITAGISPLHPKSASVLAAPKGTALPLAYQGLERWDQKRVVSPYASGYAAEALFVRNQGESAIDLIIRVWGQMADPTNPNYSGGHWEAMKPDGTPITDDTSLMHGWSTWPVHLLPRYLGGVEPLEAGWSRFMVKPVLAGLSSVDVQLATPAGEIKVSLRMREDEGEGKVLVKVPVGAIAEVSAPESWIILGSSEGSQVLEVHTLVGHEKEYMLILHKHLGTTVSLETSATTSDGPKSILYEVSSIKTQKGYWLKTLWLQFISIFEHLFQKRKVA